MITSERRKARITPAGSVGDARPMPLQSLKRRATDHPAASGSASATGASPDPREQAQQLSAPLRQAWFDGERAGLARGQLEGAQTARDTFEREAATVAREAGGTVADRMDSVLRRFETEFAAMEQSLADQALDLAVALAGELVGHQIAVDRTAVLPVIRQCLEPLGPSVRDLRIIVNPSDAELVQHAVAAREFPCEASVIADQRISPGGCRLESPELLVDGELGVRWQRALAGIGRQALAGAGPLIADDGSPSTADKEPDGDNRD